MSATQLPVSPGGRARSIACAVRRKAESPGGLGRATSKVYWLLSFVLGLGLLVVFVPSAQANESRPKGKAQQTAERTQFKKVLNQALAEFELGNWTEARALFERAHELEPSARTLRAIGLCAFEEKRYVSSVLYLQSAMEDPRSPLDEEQRRQLSDVLHRARAFVAQYTLFLNPEDATLRVDGSPPVLVDGKLMLDPGEHDLTLSAEGYHEAQRRILAQPREDLTLRIALNPLVPAVAEAQNPAPSVVADSAPVPKRGGFAQRQWLGVAAGGLGVASLATGVVLGVLAKSKSDASGCENGVCPTQAALRKNDSALRFAHSSTVTLAVGGAALAAGAFLFFWPERHKREKAVASRFSPHVSAQYGGASWEATW